MSLSPKVTLAAGPIWRQWIFPVMLKILATPETTTLSLKSEDYLNQIYRLTMEFRSDMSCKFGGGGGGGGATPA